MKFLIIFALVAVAASSPLDLNIRQPSEEIHMEHAAEANLEPKTNAEGRITNGQTATTGQFPYLVYLLIQKSDGPYYLCGGSLIGSQWIVTSAVCADGAVNVIANLGGVNHNSPNVSVTAPSSGNVFLHPDWNRTTRKHNDIALVKIPAVTYNDVIQPIKLPAYSAPLVNYANNVGWIAGWGATYDGAPISDNAQYASVLILTEDACRQTHSLIDSQMCAATTNSSFCGGDTGGPLVDQATNTLVGVASFIILGCSEGYPDFYTRVSSFVWWIKKITGISY